MFPHATLPAPLTDFVGRERELGQIAQQLAETRLLTLTGAGGSGKTRLAMAAVQAALGQDRYEAVGWVELAALSDPASLPAHVALALGARADGGGFVAAIVARLGRERTLLVLDNCEHLVEACAELAEQLLRAAPSLTVLATSRESLGVTGERSWLVPPLELPDATADSEQVLETSAVQLFLSRARDAVPGFVANESSIASIVAICRRLDGLPLAIELAAARLAVLTPSQLAERLSDRFSLLTGGARVASPRQRTLRGTVDWSYNLLGADERLLLDRLSLFVGGFTLDAAERVCGDATLPTGRVLDVLAALVAKSLVAMQEEGGQARYWLLETIREYALERHVSRDERPTFLERHALYYRDLCVTAMPELLLARGEWLVAVDAEYGNVSAALAWSARAHRGTDVGLPIVWALEWYWYHRQMWPAAFAQVETALATAQSPSAELRAAAMHGLGVFGLHVGNPQTPQWLKEARRLWREAGNERWLAFTLLVEVVAASIRADWGEAKRYADEMVELASRQPDPWDAALAHTHALVPVLNSLGRYADADAILEDALEVFRVREYHTGYAFGLDARAFVALQLGDVARAERLAWGSLLVNPKAEDRWLAGRSLRILAGVAEARGDLARAVRLSACADAFYKSVGAARLTAEREVLNSLPERLRPALPADEYATAIATGSRYSYSEMLAEALVGASSELPERTPTMLAPESSAGAAPADPVLAVQTLGHVSIRRNGEILPEAAWPYAKPRELLLYLLAHPEGRTREQIGLDFWPDVSAAQVKNNFHVTLHHLRRVLGDPTLIQYVRGRYRVAFERGVRVDAIALEEAVTAALDQLARRPDAKAARQLGEVLGTAQGHYLEHESFGDWHLAVRDRLVRLQTEAWLELGRYHSVEGEHRLAEQALRALLALDPLHEEGLRLLLLTLARLEQRSDALRLYERAQDALQREFGAAPSAALRAAAEAIRAGERV